MNVEGVAAVLGARAKTIFVPLRRPLQGVEVGRGERVGAVGDSGAAGGVVR